MCKTFFCDISKVLHWAAGLNDVDLGNCYDRVAHPPSSIVLWAWGIPLAAVKVILMALQTMQFCLRIGFGESALTYRGTMESPNEGSGKGNRGAPPIFSNLSSLVVNAYKCHGNGAMMTSSYTCRLFVLAAVMYDDDMDLIHLTASQKYPEEEPPHSSVG